MQKFKFIFSVVMVMAVPLIWYMVIHGLVYIIPVSSGNSLYDFLYYAIVVVLSLVAPYLMMKFIFHAAHLKNADEPELRLEELPKEEPKIETVKRKDS